MVADIDPQQQQQPKQSAPALPPKVALAAPPEETSTSLGKIYQTFAESGCKTLY